MQFKDKSKPDFSLLDTYNYNWNHVTAHCNLRNEMEQNETKWNETKWQSVVCEMRIYSLRNENL